MKLKYQVTDKNGNVHKRVSSSGRVYTHAIVRHWDAYTYELGWKPANAERAAEMIGGHDDLRYDATKGDIVRDVAAGSAATWAGRPDLAQKEAATARKRWHVSDVEIIPVN